ncbi:hypothetical protein [Arthrobacter bambusae]|uniref:Uncharacterized protein n=1 Tax=Arthrobacter bambusae TaxID=1338426 RepID=A0AAW8DGB2_9MICC|nr:hypothetical protein [Arthrobacter bambusae]MDP9905623.1 hypothetical protein [Arthrobacter bambusae]MDQ0127295.1 hypothetical protein [Arthrobacter bambusae]MDQ0178637.1 hypothetical protein [Arthrobacter bambusae]
MPESSRQILDAILRTIGRSCPLVIPHAAPVLEEEDAEDTPEHLSAKAALSRHWRRYGFVPVAKDYMVFGAAFTPGPAYKPQPSVTLGSAGDVIDLDAITGGARVPVNLDEFGDASR